MEQFFTFIFLFQFITEAFAYIGFIYCLRLDFKYSSLTLTERGME